MEENINETQKENNNTINADASAKEETENSKPDYKEFTVSLSSIDYEGPLSILFDMLKRSEKSIYEVSILEIIDQFVEYLKAQAALNLDSTGDFLVVASEFHLYKSKMLLPHDMDDDKFTDKLKFEIVEQMLEFQRYKMVSEELDKLQDTSDTIFERKDTERVKFFKTVSTDDNEVAWKDITLYDLVYAFTKVQFVPETDLAVLSGMSNFHIDNAIDMIRIKLSETAFFPFITLFKDGVTKRQLVTFFLAMLELVKEKEILLKQEMKFREIYVFKRDEKFMPKAEEDKSDDYEESSEESNNNSEEAPNNEEPIEENNKNTENNSSEENNNNAENLSNNENSDNKNQ
ncbi:segregation and condensation protein A [Brachyspira intermedia]|uniref:segregation and condensation protein A n=1 Tax=Brachyspira intermedia TaxID=84377 RepID=UPI00300522E1